MTASSVVAFQSIANTGTAPTSGVSGAWGITVRLDDETMMRCRRTPGMAARRLDEKDYPLMRGGIRVIYDR